MIVKVQQSLYTSESEHQMLIYNKDKTILFQQELSEEVKNLLNGRPKVYFQAEVIGENVRLIREAGSQFW